MILAHLSTEECKISIMPYDQSRKVGMQSTQYTDGAKKASDLWRLSCNSIIGGRQWHPIIKPKSKVRHGSIRGIFSRNSSSQQSMNMSVRLPIVSCWPARSISIVLIPMNQRHHRWYEMFRDDLLSWESKTWVHTVNTLSQIMSSFQCYLRLQAANSCITGRFMSVSTDVLRELSSLVPILLWFKWSSLCGENYFMPAFIN